MKKEIYYAPVVEVLQTSLSQIICQSGTLEDYDVETFTI